MPSAKRNSSSNTPKKSAETPTKNTPKKSTTTPNKVVSRGAPSTRGAQLQDLRAYSAAPM